MWTRLDVAGSAAAAPFLNGEELAHGRLASEIAESRKQRLSLARECKKKPKVDFVQRLSELKEKMKNFWIMMICTCLCIYGLVSTRKDMLNYSA